MLQGEFNIGLPLTWVFAYMVGSVNFSLLAGKLLLDKDIRESGSANAGATNLARQAGAPASLAVLALDILRAWSIVYFLAELPFNIYWPAIALPLLAGNLFPIFHQFKGGKGIATSVGIILAISPVTLLVGVSVFLFILGITRRVSLASMLMMLSFPAIQFIESGLSPSFVLFCTIAAVSIGTHRKNVLRLIHGEEPSLFSSKKNISKENGND